MIYTPLTKKALKISFKAHKDQVDKSGLPYVYHPFHLAEQMNDECSICVALLHDVVEDTDISLDDLASDGFPAEVIEALTYGLCQKNKNKSDRSQGQTGRLRAQQRLNSAGLGG